MHHISINYDSFSDDSKWMVSTLQQKQLCSKIKWIPTNLISIKQSRLSLSPILFYYLQSFIRGLKWKKHNCNKSIVIYIINLLICRCCCFLIYTNVTITKANYKYISTTVLYANQTKYIPLELRKLVFLFSNCLRLFCELKKRFIGADTGIHLPEKRKTWTSYHLWWIILLVLFGHLLNSVYFSFCWI